ncbi:MAG: hypothetical protein IKI58_07300 [Oscillospiraceae bacterium]|nr:hypothetical protein [Oscillospiraceae bacterium]
MISRKALIVKSYEGGVFMKEYKIVEIERKYLKEDYSFAEAAMNQEETAGWHVVCVSFDTAKDMRGNMVITFSRERN